MNSMKTKEEPDRMRNLFKDPTRKRRSDTATLQALFDMPFRDPLPSFEKRIREGITVDPRSWCGLLELDDL